MPIDPRKKTAKFNFGLNGVITKESPNLLSDGQYRSCSNMEVVQEGSLSSRAGRKLLSTSLTGSQCYMIRKMVTTPGEAPATPATNPRYLGAIVSGATKLYRTPDYVNFTEVASGINTPTSFIPDTKSFSLAAYVAGETGGPWAFIASELNMLKDSGALSAPLPRWGVPPAAGVATAAIILDGSPKSVTQLDVGYAYYEGVVATLDSAAAISDFDQIVFAGATMTITTTDGSTDINQAAGWAIRVGIPDGSGGIINSTTMFRIYDTNGQSVQASGAATGTITAQLYGGAGLAVVGALDGGADSSPNETTQYDYRFLYVESVANNKGNPSQTMLADSAIAGGVPLGVHLGKILVTVYGTGEPGITKINIYRRGGTLYDAWRLVGSVTNNPAADAGDAKTFTDNVSDSDLVFAELLEVDNDPPVTSTLQTPITGTLAVISAAGRKGVVATATLTKTKAGSLLHVPYDNPEDVIIEAVVINWIGAWSNAVTYAYGDGVSDGGVNYTSLQNGNLNHSPAASPTFWYPLGALLAGKGFLATFQHTHTVGAAFEINAISGQPCNLAISYQQFVLVAGDSNNPHLIYRSKGDQPESFTQNPADGSVSTVACGSPSNPIMNLYEFRGGVASLNLYGIYETLMFNGSFTPASKMAEKGTAGMRANCKTDTEIWFLSTDGVWSWDGATCRKRSESIDPIFHGQSVNGLAPLDYSKAYACVMESRRGQVYLLYRDSTGAPYEIICEPSFGDRWRTYDASVPFLQFIYTEPDTQSMIEAYPGASTIGFSMIDQYQISGGINYTADGFTAAWAPTSTTNGGGQQPFDMRLPWFDMASPVSKKLFEEILLEVDLAGNIPTGGAPASLSVDIFTDFSDVVSDTFTVALPWTGDYAGGTTYAAGVGVVSVGIYYISLQAANTGHTPASSPTWWVVSTRRTVISLLPEMAYVSTKLQSYGREAKAISFRIYGYAWPVQMTFYSLMLRYQDTEEITAGYAGDWLDLGHPHDKRLYQMVVEFDTEGTDRTLLMDTLTGVDGKTYSAAAQSFTLSNATITGAGRAKKSFPITDGIVAKMVRVRPLAAISGSSLTQVGTAFFKIFSVEFPEIEKLPPDMVMFTPWEDGDYPYLKYINQATLDVDTNNVAVTVKVQADGADVATVIVTSTGSDRDRNLTLPPGLTGRKWRLYVDPTQAAFTGGGGKFQLFNGGKIFRFQPADKGEVGHTFDWDDLGHPWDKLLLNITIEYDTSVGGPITLQMDTISGINGTTLTSNVAQFLLGSGRGKTTYPISADTVVKMVRVYPSSTVPVGYRQWKYRFDKVDYPADTVRVTAWKDASSPVDKEPSWLWIDADTSGIAAAVQLQNEIGNVMAVQHIGASNNRKNNYAIPADIYAKMWRLKSAEGPGGRFQLFNWGFERWRPFSLSDPIDPPEIILCTPWKDFGYPYEKLARNLILTINTGGVPCSVAMQTSEAGTVFTTSITTTFTNRRPIPIPCPSDLLGKMWRLIFLPGAGGRSQLWDWDLDAIQEPAEVTSWDSYEQNLGSKFFKFIGQGWWMYKCASPVTLSLISGTGTYQVTLPAHSARDSERFPLPAVWGAGLNKSKTYRVKLGAASPLKFYPSGSGLEYIIIGGDRHSGYNQSTFSEMMVAAA